MTNLARRALLLAAAATGTPGWAASAARRVAWIGGESSPESSPFYAAFRDAMRAQGWVEGANLVVDWWVAGSPQRLAQVLPEIGASRPDLVVAASGLVVRPLVDAQLPQPILFVMSGDAVAAKVVDSLPRPGVNRTGISFFSIELMAKRVELVRSLLPRGRNLALFGWPPHSGEPVELAAARSAATQMGFTHRYFGVDGGPEVDAALEEAMRWRADAVLVFAGAVQSLHAPRFAEFSLRRRVPTVSAWSFFADLGNLMTYGPERGEMYGRLAVMAHRVLQGAKPAEMPVELPTRFELVLNMKTARAIALEVPRSLLLRADRVIS
jgi:putative ABC transport system substrate-binding protein